MWEPGRLRQVGNPTRNETRHGKHRQHIPVSHASRALRRTLTTPNSCCTADGGHQENQAIHSDDLQAPSTGTCRHSGMVCDDRFNGFCCVWRARTTGRPGRPDTAGKIPRPGPDTPHPAADGVDRAALFRAVSLSRNHMRHGNDGRGKGPRIMGEEEGRSGTGGRDTPGKKVGPGSQRKDSGEVPGSDGPETGHQRRSGQPAGWSGWAAILMRTGQWRTNVRISRPANGRPVLYRVPDWETDGSGTVLEDG